jgi:hypothetical protein
MDNFLLVAILGVLALYFYSTMNVYKSTLMRVKEEKAMVEEKNKNLEILKGKFEQQVQISIDTINDSQDSLKQSREHHQALKLVNTELEHKNKLLQDRINELYANVGRIK